MRLAFLLAFLTACTGGSAATTPDAAPADRGPEAGNSADAGAPPGRDSGDDSGPLAVMDQDADLPDAGAWDGEPPDPGGDRDPDGCVDHPLLDTPCGDECTDWDPDHLLWCKDASEHPGTPRPVAQDGARVLNWWSCHHRAGLLCSCRCEPE